MPTITTPAQWLISEYEATDLDAYAADDTAGAVLGPGGSVYVQPLYKLKSIMDAGHPMQVTALDYRDSGRWWL
jgi:hypothetical protein